MYLKSDKINAKKIDCLVFVLKIKFHEHYML